MHRPMERESFWPYIWGLSLSLLFTLAAYWVVAKQILTGGAALGAIIGLGVLQAAVQAVCFLHVGREGKPHWNTLLFLSMIFIVAVVFFGSIWIIESLNYGMEGM